MKNWIYAIRPKTLTAALSPIILGTAFSISDGHFNIRTLTFILIGALAIQIGTNLTNDYFDFIKGIDDRNRVGPTKVLVEGLLTVQSMRKAIIAVFTIAALASFYLIRQGGWPIAVVAITSILFAILYTAGPYPLGHIGLAEPIELIYFGPVAVAGTYYLLTGQFSYYVILGGLIPGFLSLAILTLDNLRDYHTDKAKDKKTLCVRFGQRFGQIQYYSCVLIGFITPIALLAVKKGHLLSLSALIILPLYKPCLDAVKANNNPLALTKALGQTAICLFLFTLLFSAGWLL